MKWLLLIAAAILIFMNIILRMEVNNLWTTLNIIIIKIGLNDPSEITDILNKHSNFCLTNRIYTTYTINLSRLFKK